MSEQDTPIQLIRADKLRQKGELDEALRIVSNFLNENYDHVPAIMLAGHILIDAERFGMVHALMRRAAQLQPKNHMIWNNLGLCYKEGTDLAEGEKCFLKALQIDPDYAPAHCNIGQLYLNINDYQKAMRHLNRAIELDPSMADAYYNRGMLNVAIGNWEEGWPEYDAILGNGSIRRERIYGMIPRWSGKEGKTLIAYGEQGIGDEIAYASCIPDLAKNNKVILESCPKLYGLFKRSFGIETHGTRFDNAIPWVHDKTGAMRKIDGAVALGSLPQFYRKKPEDCPGTPYLIPDPQRRLQWRTLLDAIDSRLKVGIAWTGGNQNTGKHRRSLDLDELLPILRQNATFVSLQYMDAPEIHALERTHGIKIHHWKHAVQTPDYDDTAALVAELDLVISVTTAVVHLCGAIGQKCWVLCPKETGWFFGISGDMPWYESVKLYRQKHQWVHLIADVATDLRNMIGKPVIKDLAEVHIL